MSCDDSRLVLSAAFDGELDGEDPALLDAEAHRATCERCTRFSTDLDRSRVHLQRTPAGDGPDLAGAVLTQIHHEDAAAPADRQAPPSRRHAARRAIPAAAVFVAAALGAALLVHTGDDGPGPGGGVAAADLPARVTAAQHDVSSLAAHVEMVEHGWNPAVPERRFSGSLDYEAPESLTLRLHDETDYPDDTWPANDLALHVDEDTWSVRGLHDCPSPAQPTCTPTDQEERSVVNREPFSTGAPAPLDLIMPVQSFALAGQAEALPTAEVDGRDTIGIRTTVAQVDPLLSGLRPIGNLRQLHPADPVDLRLDRETLVPLQLTVRAGQGPDRRSWAETNGYTDRAGDIVLDVTLTDVSVNGGVSLGEFLQPSADSDAVVTTDAGFADRGLAGAGVPVPRALPRGLEPYRSGEIDTAEGPRVATRTWTDGRAWLAVSASAEWPGGRLLGDLGTIVRPVDLGAGGTGYLSEDGRRIGLHTPELDLVVSGSVTRAELKAAAGSLGVSGEPVPASWDEATTADVATARAVVQPLLLPTDLAGFGAPGLRVDGTAVSASFAGPGDRSFGLTQSPAFKLSPPFDTDDIVAVTVRGVPGRFSPTRGELEWFEADNVYRLRSPSLARAELVAIAEQLEPA